LIFAHRHDRETLCKQCASSKSHGPNESCIQPAVEYGKELEGAEAKKKRLEDKKPALITERICRVAEIRELELWLMTLQNEIDDRVVERMGRLQE